MNSRIAFVSFILFININLIQAQDANKERLEHIVTTLASDEYLGRGFGTDAGIRSADLIIKEFKNSGIQPLFEDYRQSFNHRQGILNIQGNNIVGVVEGSDPELKEEYIILGAHYDHLGWEFDGEDTTVYNGADDNASGIASIIETGRLLKANQDKLRRSVIIIAFDGEESGLIGSKYFVDAVINASDSGIEASDVVAMFSLDMVGMYAKHEGIDLLGLELLEDHEEIMAKVTADAPIKVTKSSGEVPSRTDTEPFGSLGIPSIHLFTGSESPYHKPEDDSDLLDYDGMAEVVDFTAGLTMELASADEVGRIKRMEALAKGKKSAKSFDGGFVLNMGTSNFDFKDYYTRTKDVFSFSTGLSAELRISKTFILQPEIVYEFAGGQTLNGNLRTHAVKTPVNLLLTSFDIGGFRFYGLAGGYYKYAFGGKDGGIALDFDNFFSHTDYGYSYGFGFKVYKLRMSYIWQRSLVDFTPNGDPASLSSGTATPLDVRNRAYYFKIGWMF